MFNKLLINNDLKFQILNNLIELINLNLLNEYNHHLEKKYQADEIILNYLDSLLYIYEAKNKLALKKNLTIMNSKQKQKLKKALNNSKNYQQLFDDTKTLLNIIYNEDAQDLLVLKLLNQQEENEKINKNFSFENSTYFNQFNSNLINKNNYLLMT